MTAKHRKGKNNHKHEENFFKNEVVDTEVRTSGNNHIPLLALSLFILIGGAAGGWFCFQQHQTLSYLTDNLMGLQVKIVKLQSSYEELRRSNDKPLSDSVETRLIALEESYALAQKQVGMALATAEQLKTSDLPAQVLSLHTEMKSRLAEMQQATVSLDQLGQLQTMLKGNSQEFDGVRIQVDGLATLTGELSQKVDILAGSLGEAESKLEERAGQVVTLSNTLNGQAGEVLKLREQLDAYQVQLEASVLEMVSVRELLEKEDAQRLQQASVEQQLDTVRQSLQDQNSAAHNLHSELRAQLESIQKQVTQLQGETLEETVEEANEVEAAAVEEEAVAVEVEEGSLTAKEEVEAGLPEGKEETEAVSPNAEEIAPSEEKEEGTTEEEEAVPVSEEEESDIEAEARSVDEMPEAEGPSAEEEEEEEEDEEEAPNEEETLEVEAEDENVLEMEKVVKDETGSDAEEEDVAPEEEPQEMEDGEDLDEDDISTRECMSGEDVVHQEDLSQPHSGPCLHH